MPNPLNFQKTLAIGIECRIRKSSKIEEHSISNDFNTIQPLCSTMLF